MDLLGEGGYELVLSGVFSFYLVAFSEGVSSGQRLLEGGVVCVVWGDSLG